VAVPGPAEPGVAEAGQHDVYDWPGRGDRGAEFYARIRQERWQVEQQIQATATAAGIAPGHTFTLTNAPFFSDNGEYLVTAAGYHFEENRYASGEGETIHRTDFTVIPASGLPSGAEHGVAAHLRPADGEGGGAERREYLDGQIRPREGEVPLGPSGEGR
jgi:uncharacterized protein involved in type VI secretion and phage assembly